MKKSYDVVIIGAGPSGICCAYELIRKKPDIRVLMIEKGRPIENRSCPKRKTKKCMGCKPCAITTGFAGAGAFSDGKLSLSPDVGGNLPEILGYEKTVELLKESDDIYLQFGADKNVYGVDKMQEIIEIRRKAINANLKLIECPIRHLGTEEGYKIYQKMQTHLLDAGIEMIFHTMVEDILVEEGHVTGVRTEKGDVFEAGQVVAAIGREGSEWFSHVCQAHKIETEVGTVDIGVRVEVRDEVMYFPVYFLYGVRATPRRCLTILLASLVGFPVLSILLRWVGQYIPRLSRYFGTIFDSGEFSLIPFLVSLAMTLVHIFYLDRFPERDKEFEWMSWMMLIGTEFVLYNCILSGLSRAEEGAVIVQVLSIPIMLRKETDDRMRVLVPAVITAVFAVQMFLVFVHDYGATPFRWVFFK